MPRFPGALSGRVALGDRFPGLKPWAESSSSLRGENFQTRFLFPPSCSGPLDPKSRSNSCAKHMHPATVIDPDRSRVLIQKSDQHLTISDPSNFVTPSGGATGFSQGFQPGRHSIKRLALKGRRICLDQSHTYRSSKRTPCLFSNARNSS